MALQHSACTGKVLSASGQVTTSGVPGLLYGYSLKVGTDLSSVVFNDGGSGGTALWQDGHVGVTVAGDQHQRITFSKPIIFTSDIYATLGGTGAEVAVAYVELK